MQMEDTTRREDLVCRSCLLKEMSVGSNVCKNGHGAEFIEWKCMFCCSVAVYSCKGGQLWFCEECHRNAKGLVMNPKAGKNCKGSDCPLKVHHPPPGNDASKSAFPLGCSICRAEHLQKYDEAQALMRGMDEEEKADFRGVARFMSKHQQENGISGKFKVAGPPPTKKQKLAMVA